MSGMNEFLAQYYGTNQPEEANTEKTASAEEQQIELFAKLAAENGIDLEKLSDDQVEQLYHDTFSKEAEEEAPKEEEKKEEPKEEAKADDKEEKKAQVEAELAEKQASQEKIAEADFLGRVMAHAYVNEMRKIAAAAAPEEPAAEEPASEGEAKEASTALKKPSVLDKIRGHAMMAGEKAKEHAGKAKEKGEKALESVGKKVTEKATGVGTSSMKPSHAKAVGGAAAGGAAAAAAGAGYGISKALKKDKEKKASALDELALERAAEIVDEYNKTASEQGQAGFDPEVAGDRLLAVATLGLGESEKVASATNADQAVEIRALEHLEAAGYPVQWAE